MKTVSIIILLFLVTSYAKKILHGLKRFDTGFFSINRIAAGVLLAGSLCRGPAPAWADDKLASPMATPPPFGIVEGRLLKCAAKSNCVSTSSISSVEKYSAPWEFGKSAEEEFDEVVNVLQSDPTIKIVEADKSKYYIHAEATTSLPTYGIDDVEVLLNPDEKIITYRSNSRQVVRIGSDVLSDGGTNKNRLLDLQKQLGLKAMGEQEELLDKIFGDKKQLYFFDQFHLSAEPDEVNFLD
eukprot:gene8778-9680_t